MSSNFVQLVFGFLVPALAAGAVGWFLKDLLLKRTRDSRARSWQQRLEMAEHSTQHAEEIARGLRSERSELRRRLSAIERELADRTRRLEEVNQNALEASSRARYLRAATRESETNGNDDSFVANDARLADAEQETARSRLLLSDAQRELTAATAHNQLLQSQLRTLRNHSQTLDHTGDAGDLSGEDDSQNRDPASSPAQVVEVSASQHSVLEALQDDLAAAHSALCESDAQLVEHTGRIRELENRLEASRVASSDSATAIILEAKDKRIAELSQDLHRLLRAHERGPGDHDDLERIRGIGPKTAAELEELGIRTYRQIARWSKLDVQRIGGELSLPASRITRDKWTTSAKRELKRKRQHE